MYARRIQREYAVRAAGEVLQLLTEHRLSKPVQLADAAAAITHARTNPNGAIVVLFIHRHEASFDRLCLVA